MTIDWREPTPTEMVRQLLQALGEHDGARPEPPSVVWEEALTLVRNRSRPGRESATQRLARHDY